MEYVEPEVYLVGKTGDVEYYPFLDDINATEYVSNAQSDAEELIEFNGRLCYRSFLVGLNPNVTKVREDNQEYITNILKSGHGSVLEHASANFVFHNVSRVFTHELVRHRVGTAMSQESLRYVRLEDINMWLPDEFMNDEEVLDKVEDYVRQGEELQKWLAQHFKLDETKDFGYKKKITSAMRRFAPEGLATSIGWTANMRTLRHCIEMRTSRHAEIEIRLVFAKVAKIAKQNWPALFADYSQEVIDGIEEWTTPYSKV